MTTAEASEIECAHCDADREHALADCDDCFTTCCETCYELFHAYGPCEPDARTTNQKDKV